MDPKNGDESKHDRKTRRAKVVQNGNAAEAAQTNHIADVADAANKREKNHRRDEHFQSGEKGNLDH